MSIVSDTVLTYRSIVLDWHSFRSVCYSLSFPLQVTAEDENSLVPILPQHYPIGVSLYPIQWLDFQPFRRDNTQDD